MNATLAASYLHRLDPFAIQFTDTFGIRWYGLSYAAGFVVVWLFLRWVAKSKRSPLLPDDIGDLMVYGMAGVLIGGRLGYCIGYEQSLLIGFTSNFPFWDVLAINKGGMASHGGVAGVILAIMAFARRKPLRRARRAWRSKRANPCAIIARNRGSLSSLHILDLASISCTAGLFFGRIANFVNGELWGKPLEQGMQSYAGGTPPWWSVKYPREVVEAWDPDKLPDAFERTAAIDTLAIVEVEPGDGFMHRVADAAIAGDTAVIDVLKPQLTAFYPSQLIQALSDGPILVAILLIVWLKPRKPGVVGAWFMLSYGVLRIVTEIFRQADAGVDLLFGLQRGQLLSIGMILVGVIGGPIVARRDVPKLGGILKK